MKGKKIELNEKQLRWLTAHFKHTTNDECAAKLGISPRSVTRIARELNLEKTKQFIAKCQRAATTAAAISHEIHGTYPPKGFCIPNREVGQFRKGVTPLQRHGKKKEEARKRKLSETRAKLWKSERARATFGLPQRTKLRVIPQPIAKCRLRWYLKSRGYIVDDVKRIAYYDENTKRGRRIEIKPQRWYRFEPIASTTS